MALSFSSLSSHYAVKRLSEEDLPDVLSLCKGNPTYYAHMKTAPTLENLREVLSALPEGRTMDHKYFVGFYEGGRLAAILDLITGWPNRDTAFIGWFMVHKDFQGAGTGSAIIGGVLTALKEHFAYARLGYVKGNRQSAGFWLKNQFLPTGEESEREDYTVVLMQRML